MNIYELYRHWLNHPAIDEKTRSELQSISTQPLQIEDRFYKHLEFGTGGIRGILGAGTNRVNQFTIRRITKGLAQYIQSFGSTACHRGVVIAYDSRHQSKELATETGETLQSAGIKAYIFEEPSPTPLLSFSVRKLNTIAGIVITASHNPPEYNGYKVYWEDGGQITPNRAKEIAHHINQIEELPLLEDAQDQGISWLDDALSQEYISQLKKLLSCSRAPEHEDLNIVYTPLHGTGGKIVKQLLREAGFTTAVTVPEQEAPDPTFSTVTSPNPEDLKAFELAVALATKKNADLILASDPDCDRLGVLFKHYNSYEHLTGNQVGAILLNYLLDTKQQNNTLPHNGIIIKTIVTSNLGRSIANKYNIDTTETLTGFKYIGEKIEEYESSREKTFLFGYEESCGYLSDTFVRDKDGIMSILLLCEIAANYKKNDKTLYHALEEIYEEHGYYLEALESRTFRGKDGMVQMMKTLEAWRTDPPQRMQRFFITKVCDHLKQECIDLSTSNTSNTNLPSENALHFTCSDGSWFCLRPSGTEPKLKIYVGVQGTSQKEAHEKREVLLNEIMRSVETTYRTSEDKA